MHTISVSDIVSMIAQLGTQKAYDYYSKNTKIRITSFIKPEGPIKFIRWGKDNQEKKGAISTNQLGIVASVFSQKPNYPVHFDRLFSGGGNSRSALETLLAYTPNFFICYPQKTNIYTGELENDQKHLMWCPDDEHNLGEIKTKEFKQVISEVELDVDFGDIKVTPNMLGKDFDTIEAKTVHTQMQVAIVKIGKALDFHTWIAKNDHSIKIKDKYLGDLEGVVKSLDNVNIFYSSNIKNMASLIDCIWFTNDFNLIPAVMEIEHSTGVTSGLTRMLKLSEAIPALKTNYTVIAPNKLRNKVITEAVNPAFSKLSCRYMPYSTVRELYGLLQKYNLSKIVQPNFVEPFMEKI